MNLENNRNQTIEIVDEFLDDYDILDEENDTNIDELLDEENDNVDGNDQYNDDENVETVENDVQERLETVQNDLQEISENLNNQNRNDEEDFFKQILNMSDIIQAEKKRKTNL